MHPWLHAGTTQRGPDGRPDFGLPPGDALEDWRALQAQGGWSSVVRSRQVHGALVRVHRDGRDGVVLAGDGDGHATDVPGTLLAVTAADCAPVFLADPVRRAVALLHAGWRGAAAGVVQAGVATLRDAFGSGPADLLAHLGPAIGPCCYEVGVEVAAVFENHGERRKSGPPGRRPDLPEPHPGGGRAFLDLHAALHERLARSGLAPENVSRSPECTRCDARWFSHRHGDAGRHAAFVGIRAGGRPGRRAQRGRSGSVAQGVFLSSAP